MCPQNNWDICSSSAQRAILSNVTSRLNYVNYALPLSAKTPVYVGPSVFKINNNNNNVSLLQLQTNAAKDNQQHMLHIVIEYTQRIGLHVVQHSNVSSHTGALGLLNAVNNSITCC